MANQITRPGHGTSRGVPWVPVLVGVVVFLNTSDFSALALALPAIGTTFGASAETLVWVALAPPLVATASAPVLGRLGDLWGRKRIFIAGALLFAVATAWGALAGSVEQLIATRVLFGLSATAIVSAGTALLSVTVAENERARALAAVAAAFGAGLAAGPLIGGGLVDALGWRALLAVRVPLILMVAVLAWRALPAGPAPSGARGVDRLGALVLFGVLVSLSLAVNRGAVWGWTSLPILGLFAGGALALPLLIAIERRSPVPIVPPTLLRRPGFSGAGILMAVQFAVFGAVIFLVPLYLEQGRGYGAFEAGAISAAFPLALAVTAPIAGRLAGTARQHLVAAAGLAVLTPGMAALALLDEAATVPDLMIRLGVIGLGAGLFQAPNLAVLMGTVSRAQAGAAAAATVVIRNVGISVGVALGGAIYAGARAGVGGPDITADFRAAMIVFAAVAGVGLVIALASLRPIGRSGRSAPIAKV